MISRDVLTILSLCAQADNNEEEQDLNVEEQDQTTGGAEVDGTSSSTPSEGEDDSGDEDVSGAEDEYESSQEEAGSDQDEDKDSKIVHAADGSPALRGWLHSYCDGCGTSWTYVDNIYCCKDCLDVQLEPNCYAALKTGTLDPKICGKDHEFLHIPPFDEAEWRALATEDNVRVGNRVMPRKEWLKDIKNQWGIDTESRRQLITAVSVIERFRKIVLSKRRQKASPGHV